MAAEAFLSRDVQGRVTATTENLIADLVARNKYNRKFTVPGAADFASKFVVEKYYDNPARTDGNNSGTYGQGSGFSGTLFRYIRQNDAVSGLNKGDKILSFRSTEFLDDKLRDNVGSNARDALFGGDGSDILLGGAGDDWMEERAVARKPIRCLLLRHSREVAAQRMRLARATFGSDEERRNPNKPFLQEAHGLVFCGHHLAGRRSHQRFSGDGWRAFECSAIPTSIAQRGVKVTTERVSK